jgi:hypothetical protein
MSIERKQERERAELFRKQQQERIYDRLLDEAKWYQEFPKLANEKFGEDK